MEINFNPVDNSTYHWLQEWIQRTEASPERRRRERRQKLARIFGFKPEKIVLVGLPVAWELNLGTGAEALDPSSLSFKCDTWALD